jgi:Tfp pilus assembly protein PilO
MNSHEAPISYLSFAKISHWGQVAVAVVVVVAAEAVVVVAFQH